MTDIVERANKALEGVTPGPWITLVDEVASQVQGFPLIDSENYEIVGVEGFYGDYNTDWNNAKFIAEARELVPELVAEIQRLRAEVKLARVAALREAAVVCLRRVEELAEANCRNAAAQILALIDKEEADD